MLGPVFSFLGVGVGLGGVMFWFFFLSPNVFPIAPQFNHIWFAQSSTLCIETERDGYRGLHLDLFYDWVQRGASIEECSMFQKKIVNEPMNIGSFKKKKKL
jgi:hypothetical protein